MDCEHGTYQCGAAVILQQESGAPSILVPMWCTTCGLLELRIPQMNKGDQRRAELMAAPARVPVGRAR